MTATRESKRLAFFNRERRFELKSSVFEGWRRVVGEPVDWSVGVDTSWPLRFDVAVLHGLWLYGRGDGNPIRYDLRYLESPDVASTSGLVCVFVSSDPSGDAPRRVEFDGGGVRYLLSQQPGSQLDASAGAPHFAETVELWAELFAAVLKPGCLDAWFAGEFEGFEEEHRLLTRVFGDPAREAPEWTVAAAMLCEGFLAVLAATGDPDARTALGPSISVAGDHRAAVESPDWWKAVFGASRPVKGGLPEGLLSAIYDSTEVDGARVTTAAVAAAYEDLRRRAGR